MKSRVRKKISVFLGILGQRAVRVHLSAGTTMEYFSTLTEEHHLRVNRKKVRVSYALKHGDAVVGVPLKILVCGECSKCTPSLT